VYLFVNDIKMIGKFCIIQLCSSNHVNVTFLTAVILCHIYMELKCIPDYVPYKVNDIL
jgi:hypothetical protein